MFGLFESKEKAPDVEKFKAENERVSAGLSNLILRLGAATKAEEEDQAAMESYLNRLRQEGRGV